MGLQLNMRMKIAKLSSNCSVSKICRASTKNEKKKRQAENDGEKGNDEQNVSHTQEDHDLEHDLDRADPNVPF